MFRPASPVRLYSRFIPAAWLSAGHAADPDHLTESAMSQRLVPGYLDTQFGSHSRETAADLLMQAIRRVLPEVIETFARDVCHPATTVGYRTLPFKAQGRILRVETVVPSTELRAWASEWHLKSTAIYEWAFRTVEDWERHPEQKAALIWGSPPVPGQWDWSEHTAENRDDVLSPVGAMPEVDEGKKAFLARAAGHWDARTNELIRQGFDPARVKTNLAHFEWLARFQCGSESMTAIAHAISDRCDVNVVKEPVTWIAALLQLTLRPRSKAERHRTAVDRLN